MSYVGALAAVRDRARPVTRYRACPERGGRCVFRLIAMEEGGVAAVAGGERRSGDAVGDHAQHDRDADSGDDAVRLGGIETVVGDEREHDRCQAAWAEPADECDRRTVEPGAGECYRDGHHPHDAEGEEREDDVLPDQVFERGPDHRGAEQEPDEQREQLAGLVGEAGDVVVARRCMLPNARPPMNAPTKPFPPASIATA